MHNTVTITGKLIQVLGNWMVRAERTSAESRHLTEKLVGVKPRENVIRDFHRLKDRRVRMQGIMPAHAFMEVSGIKEVDDDHTHSDRRA